MDGEELFLFSAIVCSVVLLVVFLYLQTKGSRVLELQGKWLLVVAAPVLVGLIAGGYVYRFKGFGIELETRLKDPLGEANLDATDALEEVPGSGKESMAYLDGLPAETRKKIERLSFISGRRGYYDSYAVEQYLEGLPNLKFIEVKRMRGDFICLLPVDVLRDRDGPVSEKIKKFLDAIEQDNVKSTFADSAITEWVGVRDKLVHILPEVRSAPGGVLAVLRDGQQLVGVITASAVERRIADEVLAARTGE